MLARNLPQSDGVEEPSRIITFWLVVMIIALFSVVIWIGNTQVDEYNDYMMCDVYGKTEYCGGTK